MPKDDKIEELLDSYSPQVRDLALSLHQLVWEVVPHRGEGRCHRLLLV